MNDREKDAHAELWARLEDLRARAEGGGVSVSPFLTPGELHLASARFSGTLVKSFGGYAQAERARLYFLPDYMEDVQVPEGLADFGFSDGITPIEIMGSGYKRLTHRDFLGSLLGLGIDRDVLGDIVLTDDGGRGAVAFCDSRIAPFIEQGLEKVGSDKVSVRRLSCDELDIPQRKFAPINDTVASPRLDCVVAALCSLSRARAAETITAGLTELDYECEERVDRQVSPPCIVSVCGYGKFRVHSVSDVTRKGRYRLVADKYI